MTFGPRGTLLLLPAINRGSGPHHPGAILPILQIHAVAFRENRIQVISISLRRISSRW